ncbi:flagellar export protein FliJ [Halomonas sp. 328]|uniref:flagellar export protein FliJ n=1 Tax=Halomonas sp. 328 TaxID=2776704 RepID=UPI0018A70865|nr:flagellar export protein FliJ [Halomonas sp. 328]MBF8222267.1 flagellar export protein FliJ [Halomonas sp. 328]
MSQQGPLDTLIDLAREGRDKAALGLAQARQGEQQGVAQVETLKRYRQEYAERLQRAMQEGIDPASMHNYQHFLRSLDEAMNRAQQTLAQQRQQVTRSQQQWQGEQRKLSSYDTLASRRAEQAQRVIQRQELRHSDELTQQALLRRQTHHPLHGGH